MISYLCKSENPINQPAALEVAGSTQDYSTFM